MTSIFVIRDQRVLLLYRIGSRAIADSWVGIGGHIEPDEIGDPTRAALRELSEEVGLDRTDLVDLRLRYLSLRDTGEELRHTYYFTATLSPTPQRPLSVRRESLGGSTSASTPAGCRCRRPPRLPSSTGCRSGAMTPSCARS